MPCCSIYAQNIVSLLNRATLCKQVARINRNQLQPSRLSSRSKPC